MRLKAIRLSGFKSFVDPTTVPFNTNLTGIVGPNGCGKSNTIDAVRWVMGESSAKYLRGDAMTDVIFNGSSERKPVSKASVDLIFDNSARTLRGEYAAYNEISVRRQVTRDGQSTYYMNGTKCRRKDITDLFLGTGLGPRSYAIIEQGMISRLIEAKPEELRVYVEEAAGISKYKDRRRETENRMRRTQENLERLSDIRSELERQLAHLERQAQAAEKYKELKADERRKKAELHAIRWTLLNSEYEAEELKIREHEVRLESHQAELQASATGMEEQRQEYQQRTDTFNSAQGHFYEIGARIARHEQKIEHQSQMSLQLNQDLAMVEKAILDAQKQLEQDQLAQEDVAAQLDMAEPELEMLQAGEEEGSAALLEAEEAQRDWQERWDQFAQRASEPTRRADVAQSRIQATEQQIIRLDQQLTRLRQEREQLTSDPEFGDFALLQEEVSETELQAESYQESLEQTQIQLQSAREESEQLRRTLEEERQKLQQMLSRKATLEALQKAALGQGSEAVSHWLESHQLARRPRLAQRIQVADGWETAAETVLGDYLQAVLVDDMSATQNWLSSFSEGVLTLWQSSGNTASAAGTLAEKVTSQESLGSLLGKVKTADDLAQALAMRSSLAAHESVITRDGIWIGPDWLRVARDADNEGGILARQQELEMLDAESDDLDITVEEHQADLDSLLLRLQSLEQQRDVAQREWRTVSQKLMELKSRLSAQQAKAEQLALRTDKLDQSLAEMTETHQLESEELAALRLEWQEAMAAVGEDTDERERLQAERTTLTEQLTQQREASREASDALMRGELQNQNLDSQVTTLKEAILRMESQLRELESRETELTGTLPQSDDPDAESKARLAELLEQRVVAEGELNSQRTRVGEIDNSLRELEASRMKQEQAVQGIQSDIERLRLQETETSVRLETLAEEITKRDAVPQEIASALPEEASEAEWQEKVDRAAARINRLGPINLAAIDEYAKASERKQYLDAQNDDLEAALETLQSAIRKIDKETRQRFKDTFDQINTGFAELFPRVFGGGTACLEMTGDDLLDTGVAIFARPPGKKNSTIHLLSGGEKAMTAIALVFSIFQLNPAPFCMLDEVDAPLDDANVGRYARMVREMSEKVQFVFITHNKITMEAADQLMGVTMQEPGVSRLVTVDVEEAAQLAAS